MARSYYRYAVKYQVLDAIKLGSTYSKIYSVFVSIPQISTVCV